MRNKTELRYIDRKTGKVTRVTGDTNEGVEDSMTHYYRVSKTTKMWNYEIHTHYGSNGYRRS